MQIKTKEKVKCPNCTSKDTIKRGKRKRKFRDIQQFQCKNCEKFFLQENQQNKTYPLKIVLSSISNYNLGYNLNQTRQKIQSKHKIEIPISTISSWLNQYKTICAFARLRKQAIKQYSPKNIIQKQTLNHIQPYTFKYHKAKLNTLIKENPKFATIKNYIEKINQKNFPHRIFTYNKEQNNEQRASQLKFEHLKIETKTKNNFACKLASLALNLATTNNQRHESIQNFMLINDSTTIAVEIPIYLTNWDAGYYRNQRGFAFPLNNYQTPITGHIDILQIRNGLIHILDYKPEANKTNAIEQLTIYSLALSRKLNLPLYHFKAAWFDENNYYEFFPLHAVYEKQVRMEKIEPIIATNNQ
ncbi:MAG: hypothetical protein QQN41_03960 [Nitrosopumilus sp.]